MSSSDRAYTIYASIVVIFIVLMVVVSHYDDDGRKHYSLRTAIGAFKWQYPYEVTTPPHKYESPRTIDISTDGCVIKLTYSNIVAITNVDAHTTRGMTMTDMQVETLLMCASQCDIKVIRPIETTK